MFLFTILVVATLSPAHSVYQSRIELSSVGYEFQARNSIQLIMQTTFRSRLLCSAACNQQPLCRTFDYDSTSGRCRLFEGDLTTGSIILSSFAHSIVGFVVLSPSLFIQKYNHSCQACQEDRYEICSTNTNTCQCRPHTFWNGSICSLQLFVNDSCSQIDACRADLNLTCAQNSCGQFIRCSAVLTPASVASPYGDGFLVSDYSDEFDTFDSCKWAHIVTMSGGGNNEFEMYVPDTANSFVQNSSLHIRPSFTADWFQQTMCTSESSPPVNWDNGCELSFDAQPDKTIYNSTTPYPGIYAGQCNDASNYGCARTAISGNIINPIRSARIFSSFSFTYGRLEIRAKLSVGNWLWPVIGLLPQNSVYGPWPASGQINILDSRGNAPNYTAGGNNHFTSTIHWGTQSNGDMWNYSSQGYTDSNNTLTSQWHIYGLKWNSTSLYTYIDNDTNRVLTVNMSLPLWQAYSLSGSNPWADNGTNAPFNQPFYITLWLAVGDTNGYFPINDWTGGGATTFWNNRSNWQSTWTQTDLMIDYIRVYQQ